MRSSDVSGEQILHADSNNSFETALSVPDEDIEFELRGFRIEAWADFHLNPRRLRGSDFLMRWSQGQWSEDRLVQAVGESARYLAVPYGRSGVAPDDDVRAFELYFERLEAAGLGATKRPDLLVFRASDAVHVASLVEHMGGLQELPFTSESVFGNRVSVRMSYTAQHEQVLSKQPH